MPEKASQGRVELDMPARSEEINKDTNNAAETSRTRKRTTTKRRGTASAPRQQLSQDASQAVAQSLAQLDIPQAKTLRERPVRTKRGDADEILGAIADNASQGRAEKESEQLRSDAPKARTRKKISPSQNNPFTPNTVETHEAVRMDITPMTTLLFQEPDMESVKVRRRAKVVEDGEEKNPDSKIEESAPHDSDADDDSNVRRRRRGSRGRRRTAEEISEVVSTHDEQQASNDSANSEESSSESAAVTVRKRTRRRERSTAVAEEPVSFKGSTRLEAKRQRRKEGREAGRRRHSITESEFLARRENVRREMLIREQDGLNQIAVLEDDILVEHYVARHTQVSMVGNVYLGRVQNVLPSMEAAFVDIGKGRNAVLYAGEVNWEAAGMEGKPRAIEQALKTGDTVLVQVTKDPIGHKGARLTAQITLAGRHLVLVPSGAMTGISRKLPEKERTRLKRILKEIVPPEHGVIVRTAAEGASEEQLRADVDRLTKTWASIQEKSKNVKSAPVLVKGEPELAVRVVRDIFNEDFDALYIQGEDAYHTILEYVSELSPELTERVKKWTDRKDIFDSHRVDEQLAKAFDRKVWLPSGGTLVIDRTEAMTVVDVNTGKYVGSGGTLEETVTRNNLEAAEEIVRQLRLRDIGGIIVVDFIDMVLESNRELVLRRLVECLGRDRTRHQVAEVTSLGLVQMTRKRVGQGLVEAFSTTCEHCDGRGYMIHSHPVEHSGTNDGDKKRVQVPKEKPAMPSVKEDPKTKAAMKSIAAAAKSDKHSSIDAESPVVVSAPKENEEEKASTVSLSRPTREVKKKPSRSRVGKAASSSGTVIPTTSASSAILSFPTDK